MGGRLEKSLHLICAVFSRDGRDVEAEKEMHGEEEKGENVGKWGKTGN